MDQPANNNLIVYAVIALAVVLLAWYIISSVTGTTKVAVKLQSVNPQMQTYPYQTSVFKIYVNNTGTASIRNMSLAFYLNNVQQNSYKISLAPGQGGVINASYTYQAGGLYNFEAVADPAHLLISNSSTSQSSLSITVTNASSPTVYNSIPNNGIVSTQSFYLLQSGLDFALFANNRYNIPLFNRLLGPDYGVINGTLNVITPYINDANGAYALYQNSSVAYELWIQGSIVPVYIYQIVNSYGLPQRNSTINGAVVTTAKLSNTTSLCYLFSGGWTKILEYQNSTNSSQTCTSILANSYSSNQSSQFISELRADPTMGTYQSKFIYTNSSRIGTALVQSRNTLGSFNLFDNQFGFFGAYIQRNNPLINVSKLDENCLGIVHSAPNMSVCSIYIVPVGGGINISYGLINSTMITSNYTISLFSLVNSSYVLGAHGSASALIDSLDANTVSSSWTSPFKNACGFTTASGSLPCNVTRFDTTTNTASLNITNKFKSAITVNYISCYLPGAQLNQTVGQTLAAGQTLSLNTTCNSFTIPGFSYQTSYILLMNYTYASNNTAASAVGFLNATNLGNV